VPDSVFVLIVVILAMLLTAAVVMKSIEMYFHFKKEQQRLNNIINELDLRDRDGRILDSKKENDDDKGDSQNR
jgi:hypothetical protein